MFKKMLVAGVVALGAMAPAVASASLLVDLRFADGTRQKIATPGTYTVDVWAQVRGTNTSSADDGLLTFEGSLQSIQAAGGGAIIPAAGGTSGILSGPQALSANFTNANPNGKPGTTQNLTTDNINDWGALSGASALKFSSSDGSTFIQSSNASVFSLLGDGAANAGVEIKVGSFVVTIGELDVSSVVGAETRFNFVKGTSSVPTASNRREDGAGATANATFLASVSGTNSVSFVTVPEPTTAGLLGLGALGALVRRRRA